MVEVPYFFGPFGSFLSEFYVIVHLKILIILVYLIFMFFRFINWEVQV
jgi:hypothetical protein